MRHMTAVSAFIVLIFAGCATGERNLRSHPAVFTEPHGEFVVLVPFNTAPAPAPEKPASGVKIASLDVAAVPSTPPAEPLTTLLHEFRELQDRSRYSSAAPGSDDAKADLLERMSKGYRADVAAVRFRCVDVERDDSTLRRLRRNAVLPQDRCAYISADLRDLFAIPPAAVQPPERNNIVQMLLNVSDHNCSNFLVRAFAKKTNMDSRRNTLKDIGTGLATIAASPAPGISAGLGLTNLVTGSAVDNYNASFYLEKTFQVMESAIGKERATVRARIVSNMKKDQPGEYGLFAALNDVRSYDDACSIERGLAVLSEMAAVQKDKAEGVLNGAANPESEQARQLAALADQLTRTIQQSANDRALVDALTRERQAVEDAIRRLAARAAQPTAPSSPDQGQAQPQTQPQQ